MTRGRLILLTVVAAAVGVGALLIPSGGGADVGSNNPYIASFRVGGVATTAVSVGCATKKIVVGTTPATVTVSAEQGVTPANPSTGSGGKTISVTTSGGTQTPSPAVINNLGTVAVPIPTEITLTNLPCTTGSTFDVVFQPKNNSGASVGAPTTRTITVTQGPSGS